MKRPQGGQPKYQPTMPGHKVCPRCVKEQPFTEFYPRPGGGYTSHCRTCKYDMQKNAKPVPMEKIAERFWAKVEKRGPDECWLWTGSKNNYGYGQMWTGGAGGTPMTEQVHRLALLLSGVPLPDRKTTGFVVDHACKVILCCNPRHLRIVPHSANVGELADRSMARERMRYSRSIGRGELRRKVTPDDYPPDLSTE